MGDALYHYTDLASARDILRDGVIRARPATLYKDAAGRDAGRATGPVVWLTINPILDGTIVAKLALGGWQLEGGLCRFVLPRTLTDQGIGDYADAHGIDYDWFAWMVRSGSMAGSDYTTWRLLERDILADEWTAAQAVERATKGDLIWRAL